MAFYLNSIPTADILESFLESMAGFFRGFNFFCYNLFQYGNVILFLFYLGLGFYLLKSAKNVIDDLKRGLNKKIINFNAQYD